MAGKQRTARPGAKTSGLVRLVKGDLETINQVWQKKQAYAQDFLNRVLATPSVLDKVAQHFRMEQTAALPGALNSDGGLSLYLRL